MSELTERKPSLAKGMVPEPPGWRVSMVYGPNKPCNLFAHVILFTVFKLDQDRIQTAIKLAYNGHKASIRICSRDVAETLVKLANEQVAVERRRMCQNNCEIDFLAEPLQ